MIIDLRTELERRKTTPQKEEAISIIEKALNEIKELPVEECVVAYKYGNEFRYFSNQGSAITLVGMLELVKSSINNDF